MAWVVLGKGLVLTFALVEWVSDVACGRICGVHDAVEQFLLLCEVEWNVGDVAETFLELDKPLVAASCGKNNAIAAKLSSFVL